MKSLVALIVAVSSVCADTKAEAGRQARQLHSFAPAFHQATSHSHHSTPFATHATSQSHPVVPVALRAAPLIHHAEPLAHHAVPLSHHDTTLVRQVNPFTLNSAPFVHHAAPVISSDPLVRTTAPVFHHTAPLVHHAAPLIRHSDSLVHHAHHAAPLIRHGDSLVHHAQPVFHSAPQFHHIESTFHAAPLPIAQHSVVHHTLPVLLPQPEPSTPVTSTAPVVIEARQAVPVIDTPKPAVVKIQPIPEPIAVKLQPAYSAPSEPVQVIAPASVVVEARAPELSPIVILRNINNPPAETANFDSDFETANGIHQSSVGTTKIVDNSEVTVMEGSYSYVGADDVVYTVTWYADETGFHPSDPTGHFPRAVEPTHPEVAAAVKAQIAFAAEEDAAASSRSVAYAAPVYVSPLAAYQA